MRFSLPPSPSYENPADHHLGFLLLTAVLGWLEFGV